MQTFNRFFMRVVALPVALAGLAGMPAQAAVVPLAGAAGINNSGGSGGAGTHYHTAVGTTVGVNYSFGEEGRGVAEFNLASLGTVTTASLSFVVTSFLDDFGTSGHFVDPISLFTYAGNNAIAFSDFQSTTTGLVATFATASLNVGDTLTFDVTALLNTALLAGNSSLGFLFDPTTQTATSTAIRFGNLSLTTNPRVVPEPESLTLLVAGLVLATAVRRRQRRTAA